jgi:hypothetical protein
MYKRLQRQAQQLDQEMKALFAKLKRKEQHDAASVLASQQGAASTTSTAAVTATSFHQVSNASDHHARGSMVA